MMTREQLNARLRLDYNRLDEELIDQPTLVQEAGEGYARAVGERDAAYNEMKMTFAMAADRLRTVPEGQRPPSEERIKTDALLDDEYIEAVAKREGTALEAALWESTLEGVRTRGYSLQGLGQGYSAGWLARDSAYETRRAELSTARSEDLPARRR